MARPQTRDQFIEYCLRKLGDPVIDINVDDDQVSDRVDDAIQYYQTYHFDSVEHLAIVYTLTQEDIDNSYITIPNEILSVSSAIIDGDSVLNGGFGTNIWHGMKNIAHDIGFGMGACRGGTTNFHMMMNYLAEIKFTFKVNHSIEFQYRNHHLYINTDWTKVSAGQNIVLEVYRYIDPNTYADVWNDMWLQNYSTALIGLQWGVNLSKFDGVELPGGITLDGDKIYDRYNEIKIDMEEKMQESFEEPPMFTVG